MKSLVVPVPATALTSRVASMGADGNRQAMQDRLDAECEAARELELAPARAKFIEKYVDKKQKDDRAACERFYSDYGARSGNRAPLHYDLPECAKAFELRNSDSERQ